MTSRELVQSTLEFRNTNNRVPRQLWYLPWAQTHYPNELQKILDDFEWDIIHAPSKLATPTVTVGNAYIPGLYVDEWGCRFHNIQPGVIGEVKDPLVKDEDWSDTDAVHIPDELLSFDVDTVNRFCAQSDKFVMASCNPRPFEQLQFIRGTSELYMDLLLQPPKMVAFINKMHEHYCRLVEKWAKTDVDAIGFMDDWGSQQTLLISPALWQSIFKPMYKDYIDIAKAHGKKTFMHSDGHTLSIIPDLIELGLDALNAQIFCIGIEKLAQFKGKLTFWGEIDRQQLIPNATLEEIDAAVDLVFDTLWDNGGCIAECEFGPMGKPENVYRIYEHWNRKRP